MYRGEFFERILDLDKTVTRQDILDFVSECPDSKMRSFIEDVNMECGWLFRIKASKIKEVEEYRDKQRERVSYLIACIKERTGCAPRMRPDFLTERGMNAFEQSIREKLIDKDSFEWKKPYTALANWVHDICRVGGCNTPMGMGKEVDWVSFEKYFEVKKLRKKWDNNQHQQSCPSYDKYKAKIFPELYSR